MADQSIAPINPNISGQKEAVAGNQSIAFTSTDRKLIEERGGEINKARSFKDIFNQKGLAAKVENEETTVEPGLDVDIQELAKRKRDHAQMLSNSPVKAVRDKIDTSGGNLPPPPADMNRGQDEEVKEDLETADIGKKTAQIVKELNMHPDDIVDKFHLDEKDLYNLVFKIKDLHLKRLLTNDRKEYLELTDIIKKETVAAAKPEAKEWIENRLNLLTLSSSQYKLKLLDSLKTMGWSDEQRESVKWLQQIADKYSKETRGPE